MSELIDREALLDECLNHYEVGNIEQNCTMDWICKTVRNFPAAPRWVRCEDELPEIGKRVLVSYGGYVQILKRTDSMTYDGKNYWWNEADGLWERVEEGSYWMPIEPPKEDA